MPFTKVVRTVRTKPVPQTIGEHVRAVRLKRGLLQRELAIRLAVTESTVVHWERGATVPQPKDGPVIVSFLGYLPLPTVTLAERLYAVRFVQGWTQAEAARQAGFGEDAWRDAEGGRRLSVGLASKVEGVLVSLAPSLRSD